MFFDLVPVLFKTQKRSIGLKMISKRPDREKYANLRGKMRIKICCVEPQRLELPVLTYGRSKW